MDRLIIPFFMFCFALLVLVMEKPELQSNKAAQRTVASRPEGCTGTPLVRTNRDSVVQWLRNNGNRNNSIEQVLCCMPESLRNDYTVVHSSLSAQRSHYRSPRLLFGDILNNGFIFSISGGDPSLPQAESVEVMFDNPRTQQLELIDIEFREGRRHVSGVNPDKCMSCHGSGGRMGAGGPRPIFNPFPWPRMATIGVPDGPGRLEGGGFNERPTMDLVCQGRREFFEVSEAATFRSIRNNPRFRCLEPPSSRNRIDFTLDSSLSFMNARRVNAEVRALPFFDRYRYLLAGVNSKCFQISSETNSPYMQPHEWLPEDVRTSMSLPTHLFNNPFRRGALPQNQFLHQLYRGHREFDRNLASENRQFATLAQQVRLGQNPSMPIGTGLMSCNPAREDIDRNRYQTAARTAANFQDTSLRAFIQNELYSDLLLGDQLFSLGGVDEAIVQWVFESHGVNMRDWDMSLSGVSQRGVHFNILGMPEVRSLTYHNFDTMFHPVESDPQRVAHCQDLQQRSLQAFSQSSPDESTTMEVDN
jgi:hypothetical protein